MQLNEEQTKQLKEDIIKAKKYEYSLKQQVTRDLENEYLQQMEQMKQSRSEEEEKERLRLYHEKLAIIQMRAEEKMRKEMKRAEDYEIAKLNVDQERLLKSEMQRMVNRRYLFHEAEKARELMEQRSLPGLGASSSPRTTPRRTTQTSSHMARTPSPSSNNLGSNSRMRRQQSAV